MATSDSPLTPRLVDPRRPAGSRPWRALPWLVALVCVLATMAATPAARAQVGPAHELGAQASPPRPGGGVSSRILEWVYGARVFVERHVRPMVEGEGLFRVTVGVALTTGCAVVLALLLLLTRGLTLRRMANLKVQSEEKLKHAKEVQSSEVREMADQAKNRALRRSTLFLRIMGMFKAQTKDEFFSIFGESVLKGFSAKQCAFYVYDRAARVLYPKLFELVRKPSVDGQGPSVLAREIDSPVVRSIKVTPKDGTMVGWAADTLQAARREQIGHDVRLAGVTADKPLRTSVVMPVKAKDPVTREERFIGIIGLGELEDTAFTESDNALLADVAALTGLAFESADMFELQAAELASTKELTAKERDQRKQMRSVLDRVVTAGLADKLLASPETLNLQGELVEASVFFCDVKGFTTYSEQRSPTEVVAILNEYLGTMTDVIMEHEGTLDKFVGDGIIAFWGPLTKSPDHAEQAVRAALGMRDALARLQQKWVSEGKEPLSMGMGISTGPVLFGCIGSSKKLDFTVMGDTVNLGARLETLTRKFPKYDLIISQATYDEVSGIVTADPLGELPVKGKTQAVSAFGVTGLRSASDRVAARQKKA